MMGWIDVADVADARLEVFRNLKATNATRGLGHFVLEGEKLLDRLLESERFPLVAVMVTDRRAGAIAGKVPEGVPVYVVPHAAVSDVVGYHFHRGVVSCARRVAWPDVGALAEAAIRRRGAVTVVACPGIQNPENLGAMIRLCDVFGVDFVLADGTCPDPFSRRVMRVSMGTALRVPVLVEADLEGVVAALGSRWGVEWVATVTDVDAARLERFERPARLGLVFGSEGEGLPEAWVGRCVMRLTIPMRRGAESLNLAVAAGIILHRVMRGYLEN